MRECHRVIYIRTRGRTSDASCTNATGPQDDKRVILHARWIWNTRLSSSLLNKYGQQVKQDSLIQLNNHHTQLKWNLNRCLWSRCWNRSQAFTRNGDPLKDIWLRFKSTCLQNPTTDQSLTCEYGFQSLPDNVSFALLVLFLIHLKLTCLHCLLYVYNVFKPTELVAFMYSLVSLLKCYKI